MARGCPYRLCYTTYSILAGIVKNANGLFDLKKVSMYVLSHYYDINIILINFQNKTMQMMYETIHKALVEVGLEGAYSPEDYLNFFCLGNREAAGPVNNIGNESPSVGNTPQVCYVSLSAC